MDRVVEAEGKTVEEAVQEALDELGVSRDEVEVEILRENKKGLLVFDKKNAKVKVIVKDKRVARATRLLGEVLESFGLEADITNVEIENRLHFNIEGEGLGILIGRHGSTLRALQYILGIAANKGEKIRIPVILDIEGYRLRTEKSLKELAERLAEEAVLEGRDISLRPMDPFERKIIHEALSSDPRVQTISEGEGSERRVIIHLV